MAFKNSFGDPEPNADTGGAAGGDEGSEGGGGGESSMLKGNRKSEVGG